MQRLMKRLKNDRGSATIEFLGMVPYVFLMMVMLWQIVVGAYVFITVQAAANEAAKVYSVTNDKNEAQNAATKMVSSLQNVVILQTEILDLSDSQFRSFVSIDLSLVFLPEQFMGMKMPTVPISQTVEGRKI